MTRTQLSIERLRIRVRGATPEAAQAAVAGLGPELLERLLPYLTTGATPPVDAGARLDLGVRLAASSDAASLRATIADAVAAGIALRLDATPGSEGGRP